MTLDKLAAMTRAEFVAVRKNISGIRDVMATKDDLKHFATKEDLRELRGEIIDEVRKETRTVIESSDHVVTKLDTIIKDFAAHDSLHGEITDKLYDHGTRITKLEKAKAA